MTIDEILRAIRANPTEKHPPLMDAGTLLTSMTESVADVIVVKRIGLGTHAEVYEVVSIDSEEILAMKVEKPIKQAHGILLRELSVLKALSHLECVPRVFGEFSVEIASTKCVAFALEQFVASLSSFKQSSRIGDILHILPFLAAKMFACVSKVHDAGYLHRDIKPSNFMFKLEGGEVKIALIDFGSSIAIGERNVTEFRGTGAYLSLEFDPWQSTCLDDVWAVAFCLLDLAVPGGLPWRSLSARSVESRDEIRSQKIALLEQIKFSESNALVDSIPAFLKRVLLALYSGDRAFFSMDEFSAESTPKIINAFASLLPTFPKQLTLNHREALSANGLSRFSLFAFPPPSDSFLRNASALISSMSASLGDHNSVKGAGICISQLVQGRCLMKSVCPLLHFDDSGILGSAVNRWFRQKNSVCLQHVVGAKCRGKICPLIHLNKKILEALYLRGSIDAS